MIPRIKAFQRHGRHVAAWLLVAGNTPGGIGVGLIRLHILCRSCVEDFSMVQST